MSPELESDERENQSANEKDNGLPDGAHSDARASECRAPMEPIGLVEKSGKGWQVVHRCTACGHRQPNRLVREGDAPDDLDLVLSLPWL